MNYQKIRENIVFYAKKMYEEKLVAATSGNLSVRLPDRDDAFAITPSSEDYASMTSDRIVIMTLDGEILESAEGAKPSSEWRMHAEIYRSKKEVSAIVHTHSTHATAFAVLRKPIPEILIEMSYWLEGDVPVSDFAEAGTVELGYNAAKTLKNRNVCLLANHGVVAAASSLSLAYTRCAYIEDAAKICLLAKTIGEPVVLR